MDVSLELIAIVALWLTTMGFLLSLHRDVAGLREKMGHLEGRMGASKTGWDTSRVGWTTLRTGWGVLKAEWTILKNCSKGFAIQLPDTANP